MKRLEMAFAALRANGFICSEGRGFSSNMTAAILKDAMKGTLAKGYVFYTSQDEKAYKAGVPLRVYCGGNGVKDVVYGYLTAAGFEVENG
jgi:hypothetical protein